MILPFLALAAATIAPGQIMAGSAFERFAWQADRSCPARHLRTTTPGDLSWQQESFEGQLNAAARERLAQAGGRQQPCTGNGLACPTSRSLDAMARMRMLPAFVRYACTHPAPSSVDVRERPAAVPAMAAGTILRHLDLNSFANSTGPRRQAGLHTPGDYGFVTVEGFADGWAQMGEAGDRWHLSALLLDRHGRSAAICFVDAGGKGARYRATQVLEVTPAANGRWTAVPIADRPGCRNDPPLVPASTPAIEGAPPRR
jgi:hypothetical protein